MKKTVNFTIGDGAGAIIMNLAQEHLLYGLDPQKAFNAITQSLIGCPDDIAKQILKGDLVLPVDEESQQVICVPREDHHKHEFPAIDFQAWFRRKGEELEKAGESLSEQLDYFRREAVKSNGVYLKEFDYKNIFEFLKGNIDPVVEELYQDEHLMQLGDLIRVTKNYIENGVKFKETYHWVNRMYPELELEYDDRGILMDVMSDLQALLDISDVEGELDLIRDDAVTSYIQNIKEIDEVLSKGIEPVDILDKYDAGWLSPEGEYYALNGDIANMLHTQIADALQEAGIVPTEEDLERVTSDTWLEQQGWCRIHDNNVQFAGNLNEMNEYSGLKNVYMTEKQKDMIVQYIAECHTCEIKLGWRRTRLSVGMFAAMDWIALHKHFEF